MMNSLAMSLKSWAARDWTSNGTGSACLSMSSRCCTKSCSSKSATRRKTCARVLKLSDFHCRFKSTPLKALFHFAERFGSAATSDVTSCGAAARKRLSPPAPQSMLCQPYLSYSLWRISSSPILTCTRDWCTWQTFAEISLRGGACHGDGDKPRRNDAMDIARLHVGAPARNANSATPAKAPKAEACDGLLPGTPWRYRLLKYAMSL
mmetsp:Transcript_116512/g.340901  ORF Transcript_116512/g.340901 Transcript_116512/m.340901 type:complete len:207 (-) Transcript_116512:2-622(-)